MKRPIGLAIAFTAALRLLTHEPQPVTQAIPANLPVQQAQTSGFNLPGNLNKVDPAANPAGPSAGNPAETPAVGPVPASPKLEQANPLDVPHRIASLVPGVERFFEAAARK